MDARRWPVRVERLLTIHTYFYESSNWKVTVVGLECDNAAF